MAKYELILKDSEVQTTIQCEVFNNSEIEIIIKCKIAYSVIYLDKSTAIKFAKTLRTEINKITDNEV